MSVSMDREQIYTSDATVDYRDDGVARVSDERFAYQPFVTRREEPGPPELGPYGSRRLMWMPETPDLPTIARVRALAKVTCTLADEETYKAHDTYHLVFNGESESEPRLQELWVDAHSHDIWKLIVTGPVIFDDGTRADGLAQFQVELGYTGPYLLVNHVVWSYRLHQYSQYADYFGEYTYGDYAFPSTLPSSYFLGFSAPLK
ncbi:MAG TPA: hypothetical protein VKT72_10190 [Candidatus Baltobacteraceae bacterium]|nr:hypothetical protein [Candidatus Baltobacteraceae bacterium]